MIYVPKGTLGLARALSRRPEVVAIIPEAIYKIPQPDVSGGAAPSKGLDWNISQIGADKVWESYTRGSGMVVANIDTGVQYDHPALVNQYRGNNHDGSFTHEGNWFDPTGICGATPCDINDGHGTHTMGTMVGSEGDRNQIGVAPEATWIACKACDSSLCYDSALKACAQWAMDPGNGQAPPDVVNNSWGRFTGEPDDGRDTYEEYVGNWGAAGIFPAFAAGNEGPSCGSCIIPGDYLEAFATGATDSADAITSWSSRGPSSVGGGMKPNIAAPGDRVRSSVPNNRYFWMGGTSMASPHTAGTVALIWAAAGDLRGDVGATIDLLQDTALPLASSTQDCGGVQAGSTPNNVYGWGRLDAFNAVSTAVGGSANDAPVVSISSPSNGASFDCQAPVDFAGTASDMEDGDLSGSINWADGGTSFGTGAAVSNSYECSKAGNHNIVATVTDSEGASGSDAITINIATASLTPAAPSNLTASVFGSVVTLTWVDNSTNETGFRVEVGGKKNTWSVAATVGADQATTSLTPGQGNWKYRVIAYKESGDSAPSNVVSVRVR
jgi:subtilisin family serine protease